MEILHETVQPLAQLPFKFYEHNTNDVLNVAPHWHQEIELNYLVQGDDLKFIVDGQTTEYHPGDIWVVNHRDIHSATGDAQQHYLEFGLIIDDDFLRQQIPQSKDWQLQLQGANSSIKQRSSYQKIKHHLMMIQQLLQHSLTDISRLEVMSQFYGLLHELGANFNHPDHKPTNNQNAPLLDTVMSKINQNYADNIDGNSLADEFHVSLTTLNQQFNANVQMSVNRYLRLIRLLNSRKLLLETDRTIDYIAASCGFSSSKTFNRNFKAWKGLTPTDYRNSFAQYHKIDTTCF